MKDNKFVRGQIWWMEGYELHKMGNKKRPALIVSNEKINNNLMNDSITIVPITSNIERADIETNILFDRYTRCKNIIKCSDITTVYKTQLTDYESTLDKETMDKVDEAIKIVLGLNRNEISENLNNSMNEPSINSIEGKKEVNNIEFEKEIEINEEPKVDYEPQKTNKRVKWTAENEALFMQTYSSQGVEETMKKFQLNRKTIVTMAYKLRQKYPEFKTLRNR